MEFLVLPVPPKSRATKYPPTPDLGRTLTNTTMLLKVVPPLSFQFQIFLLDTSTQTQSSFFISSSSFDSLSPRWSPLDCKLLKRSKSNVFMAVTYLLPLPTVHTQTALAYSRSFKNYCLHILLKLCSLHSGYSGLFCAEFLTPSELRTSKVASKIS